jgi:nitrate reductase gamma subunit
VSLFISCVAILVTASYLAYAFVKPRWNAPGYPSYIGYGKNVEHAAFALTVLGVTGFAVLSRWQAFSLASLGWLAVVMALLRVYYAPGVATAVLLALVAAGTVYFTWYDRLRDQAVGGTPHQVPRGEWRATALFLPVVASWIFLHGFRPVADIDLHHDGEVISSAIDLLDGGIPFRTHFWPHGISDSGLAALLVRSTGNIGLGTILFVKAISLVIGFLAFFLMALGLLRQPLEALLLATLTGLVVRTPLVVAARSLFPIVTFLLLSVRTDRLAIFGAGALIGLGYVWRIDTGVFALATVVLYLLFDRYYARGYARDGLAWRHLLSPQAAAGMVVDIVSLLAGVGLSLFLLRLALGFPTFEWFRTTLVELPRYHADSTGWPLPILWNGVPLHPYQSMEVALAMLPAILLLAVGLYAFTVRKVAERRLRLDSSRARYFVLLLIYALLGFKTVMDRSRTSQVVQGSTVMLLLVVIDGLEVFHWRRRRPWLLISILSTGLVMGSIAASRRPDLLPRFLPPGPRNIEVLYASLRPTPTAVEMLAQSSDPKGVEILRGVQEVKKHLDAHGVGEHQLLVYHGASQLYSLLGRKLPTQYYVLGWAADPRMERDLIGDLERSRVRAYLHVNGIGRSMADYDVPDSHRIPLVHRFITEKESTGQRYETAIGTLTIRDEP